MTAVEPVDRLAQLRAEWTRWRYHEQCTPEVRQRRLLEIEAEANRIREGDDTPTHCERCGQPLLLRRPGRTVCGRCVDIANGLS